MNILAYSINLLKRNKSAERTVDDKVTNWSCFKGALHEGGQLAFTCSFHNLKQSVVQTYTFYIKRVQKFFSLQIC